MTNDPRRRKNPEDEVGKWDLMHKGANFPFKKNVIKDVRDTKRLVMMI